MQSHFLKLHTHGHHGSQQDRGERDEHGAAIRAEIMEVACSTSGDKDDHKARTGETNFQRASVYRQRQWIQHRLAPLHGSH